MQLLFPGYTAVMPWQGIPLEEAMPVCERADSFTVDEIKLVEKQTCPPDFLTEAELITLMEKHGIGTRLQCSSKCIPFLFGPDGAGQRGGSLCGLIWHICYLYVTGTYIGLFKGVLTFYSCALLSSASLSGSA